MQIEAESTKEDKKPEASIEPDSLENEEEEEAQEVYSPKKTEPVLENNMEEEEEEESEDEFDHSMERGDVGQEEKPSQGDEKLVSIITESLEAQVQEDDVAAVFDEESKEEDEAIEEWDKTQTLSVKKSVDESEGDHKGEYNLEMMIKRDIKERNQRRYLKKDPTIEVTVAQSPDVEVHKALDEELEENKEEETIFDQKPTILSKRDVEKVYANSISPKRRLFKLRKLKPPKRVGSLTHRPIFIGGTVLRD